MHICLKWQNNYTYDIISVSWHPEFDVVYQWNVLSCFIFPIPISFNYRMFHVVQFLDEQKSVSVVPQSWYNNGATYWPSYKSDEKIHKAARSAEQPSQHWTKHDVRVLKTCDDYMSAWRAMKKSFTCQTSELDTDHGEEKAVQRFKRKRKPIHRFGETDSENDQEEVPQNNQARSRQPSKSKSSETQQSLSCSAPPVPPPYRSSLNESSLSPPPPPVSSPRRSSSLNESEPSLMPPESSPQASSPRCPVSPSHWSSLSPIPNPHRSSTRPGSSPRRSSARPGSSPRRSSTRPGSSPRRSSARPGSSPRRSSARPGSSPRRSSARPGSSPRRSSARPGSSPRRSSARPGSSPRRSSARPGSSPRRSSAHPGSSPRRSSAHPGSSPRRSSPHPGSSPCWSSPSSLPSPRRSSARPGSSSHRSSTRPGLSSRRSSSCPVPSSQPSSFSASHSQSSLWSQDTPELFRPSFRVGRSGIEQIPCSAAELHILKLLEHMKHQLTQLIAMVNLIPGRMVDECPTEVPEGIQFPFGSLEEVVAERTTQFLTEKELDFGPGFHWRTGHQARYLEHPVTHVL
ncbi:hypothetical protein ABVT39_027595 [Epinephelus coioides]